LKWRKQLFYIHYFTLFVLAAAIGALSIKYAVFKLWNLSGDIPVPVVKLGAVLDVLRYVASLATLLFASLGWGISTNQLSGVTLMWLTFISFSLVFITLIQKVILEHDPFLHFARTVPAVTIPGGLPAPASQGGLLDTAKLLEKPDALFLDVVIALLYASLISWIYESLVNLLRFLQDNKQGQKFDVFNALYKTLLVSFAAVVLGMLFAHLLFSFNTTASGGGSDSSNGSSANGATKTWKYVWIVQHLLEEGVY